MDTTVAGLDVRVRGAGEPVLLVHGSGGGADSWDGVAERLAERFEVWSFVRRGYGPCPVPDRGPTTAGPSGGPLTAGPSGQVATTGGPSGRVATTFAAEVPDVRALLDAIGRPAHLVGASLGATLALHAAAADPRGVLSLALFEPPLLLPGPHVPGVRARYEALVAAGAYRDGDVLLARELLHAPAPLVDMIGSAPVPDPVEAAREARGWAGDLAQLEAEPADADRFSAVTLPVLLLSGADSWSPLPEGVDALARALPHAERVVWEGQSHFATATAPQLFASTVAEFAGRHGQRGGMATPTTDPAVVVRELLAALERFDLDAASALLAPDVVYENVSLPPARGRDAAARLLRGLVRYGTAFEVATHRLVADGATVLTERTDTIVVGRLRCSFWVCGTFEVDAEGRIVLWRDYFDWANATGGFLAGAGRAVASLLRR